ncbi:MAG: DUF4234 domain-containing protein [Clostridia bacterium]|nr:DUF4234 domain-containing protein [Clostridia bacterium]MBQ8290658.1 DUF4234 domain-containing protein [Clostridia bacterium]
MKRRSVPLAILFTIITLGLYGLYWFVCLTNDTNSLAKSKTAGGVMALVFSVITLGLYSFYWIYMLGVKDGEISGNGSRGALYLVLCFFGLGFLLAPILTQNTLNNAIERNVASY